MTGGADWCMMESDVSTMSMFSYSDTESDGNLPSSEDIRYNQDRRNFPFRNKLSTTLDAAPPRSIAGRNEDFSIASSQHTTRCKNSRNFINTETQSQTRYIAGGYGDSASDITSYEHTIHYQDRKTLPINNPNPTFDAPPRYIADWYEDSESSISSSKYSGCPRYPTNKNIVASATSRLTADAFRDTEISIPISQVTSSIARTHEEHTKRNRNTYEHQEGMFNTRYKFNYLSKDKALTHNFKGSQMDSVDYLSEVRAQTHQTQRPGMIEVKAWDIAHVTPSLSHERLKRKIQQYNRKVNMESFRIRIIAENQKVVDFEGVLRFYYNNSIQTLCKAVRLRGYTTVAILLETLRQKFGMSKCESELELWRLDADSSSPLCAEDKPLDIALHSPRLPLFVLKSTPAEKNAEEGTESEGPDPDPPMPKTDEQKNGDINDESSNEWPSVEIAGTKCQKNKLESDSQEESHQDSDTGINMGLQQEATVSNMAAIHTSAENITIIKDTDVEISRGRSRVKQNGDAVVQGRRSKSASKSKRDTSFESEQNDSGYPERDTRPGSLRSSRSRSMSNLLQKTFSLRKKRNLYSPQTELSTDDTVPGVLRIFGDSVSPGTHYKSVLAVSSSSALEIIKEALDRYSIPRNSHQLFVLCDVIGRLVTYDEHGEIIPSKGAMDEFWLEDCIRIIGDNERPLILQSYWKPAEKYSRRFELRSRQDLQALEDETVDNMAVGILQQHHEQQQQHPTRSTKTGPMFGDNPKLDHAHSLEVLPTAHHTDTQRHHSIHHHNNNSSSRNKDITSSTSADARHSKGAHAMEPTCTVPSEPFFLNLRGGSTLVCPLLATSTVTVGSDAKLLTRTDLHLDYKDIFPKHCVLKHTCDDSVELEVIHKGAVIKINNVQLQETTAILNSGDVISIGESVVFIFRNPGAEAVQDKADVACDVGVITSSLKDTTMPSSSSSAIPVCKSCKQLRTVPEEEDDEEINETQSVIEWRAHKTKLYEKEVTRLKICYIMEREDDLLERCVCVMDRYPNAFSLTPAYMFSMVIEYCSLKYSQFHTRKLLLKVANILQSAVWERTKLLADRQGTKSESGQSPEDSMWPDLLPVIMWMSNSLELFHFLHHHLHEIIMERPPQPQQPGTEEEVMATLEDVVMYTFQQTVYYLTKTLYLFLPAIFDNNPFSSQEVHHGSKQATMDTLINVLQTTLNFLLDYKLHPQVLSQLFCYLFFFMSTSLFNTLMGKDAGSKYFKWSKSVQLRGNLDVIQAWATENHLQEEAGLYLRKINCLVDLLAMPRVQLQQASWDSLHRDFPALSSAQLVHVLSNPNLIRSRDSWVKEGEQSQKGEILENFQDHPPLVLPESGYMLDLSRPIEDPLFTEIVKEANIMFSQTEDDGDSGLSMSHNASTFSTMPLTMFNAPSLKHCISETSEYATATESLSSSSPDAINKDPHKPPRRSKANKIAAAQEQQDSTTSLQSGRTASKQEGVRSKSGDRTGGRRCVEFSSNMDGVANVRATNDNFTLQSSWDDHVGNIQYDLPGSDGKQDGGGGVAYEQYNLPNCSFQSDRPMSSSHGGSGRSSKRQPMEHSFVEKVTAQQRRQQKLRESRYKTEDLSLVTQPKSLMRKSKSEGEKAEPMYMNIADVAANVAKIKEKSHRRTQAKAKSPVDGAPPLPAKGILRKVVPPLDLSELEKSSFDDINTNNNSTDEACARVSVSHGQQQQQQQHHNMHTDQRRYEALDNSLISIDLHKGPSGLGVGLIDGLFTPLQQPGIYVRTLVSGGPAERDGRLKLGDRILAVSGISVVGATYQMAMDIIKNEGDNVQFVIARSDVGTAMKITASAC